MAIIGEETLIKDIRSKRLSNIYFIFGNDSYLKQYYCDKISSIACTGDPFFNLQKFDNNSSLQDVYDAIKQYPMMADSKYVSLEDYDFAKCEKGDFEKLCTIISETSDGCVFVLKFDAITLDIKKDSRTKKLISLACKNGGKVVELNHRPIGQTSNMLVKGALKRGCNLSESNARYIIEKSGEDISLLKNELDKLCAFVKSGEITKEIIDKVCVKTVESSLYDFATFIISGKLQDALKILDDMFFMRIEPLVILHSVSSVYLDIYRVYEGQKSNKSIDDIASDFDYGSRKFILNKTIPKLKNFNIRKLSDSFSILLTCDKALKSFSGNERLCLEKMTVDLFNVLWGNT